MNTDDLVKQIVDDATAEKPTEDVYWSPANVLERRRLQAIKDATDQFYDPDGFRLRQQRRKAAIRRISSVFVQGISYGD